MTTINARDEKTGQLVEIDVSGSGGTGDAAQSTSLAIKAKTDNLPAAPADNAEVETASLASGGGSKATTQRAGKLLRYIADNLGGGGTTEYDGVYVDSVNGDTIANGATGSPNKPLSTIAEALTTAATNKTPKLYITTHNLVGNLALPSDLNMTPIAFIGLDMNASWAAGPYGIDLNGKNVSGCYFQDLYITGDDTLIGAANFRHCNMDTSVLANGTGLLDNCLVYFRIRNSSEIISPTFYNARLYADGGPNVYDARGAVTIYNVAGASVNIHGVDGLLCTIDASCTAGTINVEGNARVINNSTGTCVVNDNTINKLLADIKAVTAQMVFTIPNRIDATVP